jgi:hypothetical protein
MKRIVISALLILWAIVALVHGLSGLHGVDNSFQAGRLFGTLAVLVICGYGLRRVNLTRD